MITIIDRLFLENWKKLDFTTWKEVDVREEFIAPLLNLLGYAKGTINDILREENLKLSEQYHRIGRMQVSIDYVPTVRLKKFWIIEAKAGKDKLMDYGDYLQAHLYAIHPEINARFILLTNGWEIRLFDALYSKSWDDYLMLLTSSVSEDDFLSFKNFISATEIKKSIRNYILSTIEESLKVEIDENEISTLKSAMNKLCSEALPTIRQNALDIRTNAFFKKVNEYEKFIASLDFKSLLVYMDKPTESSALIAKCAFEIFCNSNQEERDIHYGELVRRYRGRPHGVFRIHALELLFRMLNADINASDNNYGKGVADSIDELISSNVKYWAFPYGDLMDQLGYAPCHLDNTCARVSYKFVRKVGLDSIVEIVKSQRMTFSIEDLLEKNLSVAGEVVNAVEIIYDYLWRKSVGGRDTEIWNDIWALELLEEFLDKMPEKKYPDGDADFLFFQNYGKGYDMLCHGTWMVVNHWKDRVSLTTTMNEIASMSREEVLSAIPKSIERPKDWSIDLQKYAQSIGLKLDFDVK